MNVYQVWIIPNGQLTASLSKTNAAPGLPGLNGMFTVMLMNIGGTNPTHNASAGWMSTEEVAYLQANLDPSFLVYAPVLVGDERPETPLATIARLGYQMWQPPL